MKSMASGVTRCWLSAFTNLVHGLRLRQHNRGWGGVGWGWARVEIGALHRHGPGAQGAGLDESRMQLGFTAGLDPGGQSACHGARHQTRHAAHCCCRASSKATRRRWSPQD